jgi:hypothetical protein
LPLSPRRRSASPTPTEPAIRARRSRRGWEAPPSAALAVFHRGSHTEPSLRNDGPGGAVVRRSFRGLRLAITQEARIANCRWSVSTDRGASPWRSAGEHRIGSEPGAGASTPVLGKEPRDATDRSMAALLLWSRVAQRQRPSVRSGRAWINKAGIGIARRDQIHERPGGSCGCCGCGGMVRESQIPTSRRKASRACWRMRWSSTVVYGPDRWSGIALIPSACRVSPAAGRLAPSFGQESS